MVPGRNDGRALASIALSLALSSCVARAAAPAPPPGPSSFAIVYERGVGRNEELSLIPAGGGAERPLASHPAADRYPRWTPDGRSVIFSSERSGGWQLWEVSEQDGEPRRLRTSGVTDWQGDPSPDGRRIVFISDGGGADFLGILERGSGRLSERLRHGGRARFGNADWSPDGRRIAFSSNAGIGGHRVYVAEVATGKDKLISGLAQGGCEPRFSPDGRRVAHVRGGFLRRGRNQIVERDLETGEERVLVDWPARNYDPVYSPDGAELAFVSTVAGGEFALYRMRLSDRRAWRLSFGGAAARHPDYKPASP